eukprot:8120923-Pyramimonas_sp.AAC.1
MDGHVRPAVCQVGGVRPALRLHEPAVCRTRQLQYPRRGRTARHGAQRRQGAPRDIKKKLHFTGPPVPIMARMHSTPQISK